MCQLKSKGGRCNGWYANQLNKVENEIISYISSVRTDDKVSEEDYEKEVSKLKRKKDKLIQGVKEKEIIQIDPRMSLEDFKRDRKRIAKSLEVYKKFDPIKYEETLNQVGAILVDRLEIKSSMSYNLFSNDPELKDFFVKELKTGNVSMEEFKQFQIDPKKYKKYIKEIEDSPHPAIQKMVSNCKKMESLEEDDKIFKIYILEKDETEKNIEKIKNYLNSLGIKTGDPIERIVETKGKEAKASLELYKRYSNIIPTHFFDKNDKKYILNNNKTGRANVRTKEALEVEKVEDQFTKNNVSIYLKENPKMSNNDLQKIIEENTKKIDLNSSLKDFPLYTLDHESVERDSEGNITSYKLNGLQYKAGVRKPNNKSKDVTEWEFDRSLEYIGYSKYNLYRKKRVVKAKEETEENKRMSEINLSKDASYNTKIHEFTHVLENSSSKIMSSQKVIYESRKEQYFKKHNIQSKGYNKDNGIFHDNLFEEEYMNKYYSQGGYEIYTMKVPEMLSGIPSKNETKVRNAFIAMLALE